MEPKDDSRPFFNREKHEVGIYLDAYDAVPADPDSIGSHHFQMMSLRDQLFDCWSRLELVELKTKLNEQGLCRGLIPLGFEKGVVLRVYVDQAVGLDRLEEQSQSGALLRCLQDYLVSSQLLQMVEAVSVRLQLRLFADETDACRQELAADPGGKLNILNLDYDQQMLLRAREQQRRLSHRMLEMRDAEYKFDQKLGNFMLVLKQTLGPRRDEIMIDSVSHLEELRAQALEQRRQLRPLDDYLAGLKLLQNVFVDVIQRGICYSLQMVRSRSETKEQHALKQKMLGVCELTLALLRSEKNLQKVSHSEWLPKILPREQTTFLGIVSLMPYAISNAIDIDTMLDDYMNPFGVRYGSK